MEWGSPKEANEGINQFIDDCYFDNVNILDMTSHVSIDSNDCYSYTFIFKLNTTKEVME